jgi:hypothetical protein
MSEINEGKGMSTAKPRKTTRSTTRKPKTGEAPPTPTEERVTMAEPHTIPSVEAAPVSATARADAATADDTDVTEDEIRRRAYELYVSRGAADGDDLSDWLEAERLVRGSRRSQPDAGRDGVRSAPPSP